MSAQLHVCLEVNQRAFEVVLMMPSEATAKDCDAVAKLLWSHLIELDLDRHGCSLLTITPQHQEG